MRLFDDIQSPLLLKLKGGLFGLLAVMSGTLAVFAGNMKDYYVRQAYHKRLAAAIVEVFERNGVKCQHAKAALEYAHDAVGERMANAVIRPSEIKEVEGFYSGENPYAPGLVAATKENIEMLAREKREKEEARLKESQQSDPG